MHMNSYYNLMCGFPDFIICLSILIFITPIHVLIIQSKFKIFQGLPLFYTDTLTQTLFFFYLLILC